MSRIVEKRQIVEERLWAIRTALDREVGRAPGKKGWILALIAGAAGLSLAMTLAGTRKRKHLTSRG